MKIPTAGIVSKLFECNAAAFFWKEVHFIRMAELRLDPATKGLEGAHLSQDYCHGDLGGVASDPSRHTHWKSRPKAHAASGRTTNAVSAICSYEATELLKAGKRYIIDGYDAAHSEEPIHIEKIHKSMVESVHAVDEGEVHLQAIARHVWKGNLRLLFTQLHELAKARLAEIIETNATPLSALVRVNGDVSAAPGLHHCLADEERGDAVGETNLETDGRTPLADQPLEQCPYLLVNGRLHREYRRAVR